MDLKKIQAFRMVAEYENLSKAAVHLSVSQSLISKYLTDLETELSVRLLYRNGRGAQLTPEGERFLDYARRIDNLILEATSDIQAMKSNPRGTVVIGVSSAIGATLTIPLIKFVRERYPLIHIQIAEATSGYVHEWLNTGRIDIAVVFDKTRSDSLAHENLTEEDLFLVTPRRHPSAPGVVCPGIMLKALPFLLPSRANKLRVLVDAYTRNLGFEISPIAEIDSLHPLVLGVIDGLGHSILPYGAVRSEILNGRISASRIVSPPLKRMIHLATSTQRVPTSAARIVGGLIKTQVAELDKLGYWRPTDEMLDQGRFAGQAVQ